VGVTESGAVISEAAVNLRVELDVMRLLRARGYAVVVSRTRATTVIRLDRSDVDGHLLTVRGSHDDVTARDVCANRARAAILIGIYMNSGGAGAAGCVTAYDADRSFAAQNRRLAVLLQRDVLGIMNAHQLAIPDGGVSADAGLGSALSAADESYGHLMLLGPAKPGYFSTPSRMPGALIEPLFLTDPFEASVAASSQGQHLMAAGIARAIGQYFAAARADAAGAGLRARTAPR
jgi:N-acetylmuramoyl-L-alanine amidase